GVFLWGPATGNSILGNFIHDNAGSGIQIRGDHNLDGGTGAGACIVIAFNGVDGVSVQDTGTGNSILSNSIHDNGASGIYVHTPYANNNQAPPIVTSITGSAAGFTLTGIVPGGAGPYLVQVFANAAPDPSGAGEGQTFVGSFTTDANGNFPNGNFPDPL